jgi:hypothetical protein
MNIRTAGLTLMLLAASSLSAVNAQQARLGMHGGYQFELSGALVGAQLRMPIGGSWDLYPSFDYYFADDGNVLGFNGDVVYRMAGDPLFLGGGLNVLDSDAGFSLFGGFESRQMGASHPYVEVRGLFHDEATLQLTMGINFTMN